MKVIVRPGGELLEFAESKVAVRELVERAGLKKQALAVRLGNGLNLTLADEITPELAAAPTAADGTEVETVGGAGNGAGGAGAPPDAIAVEVLCKNEPEGLDVLRHSAAHIMADAVTRLYPGAKLAIGPAIEEGFYYDIDFSACESAPKEEDLPAIEKEMKRIAAEDLPFERTVVTADEALARAKAEGDRYKAEIIEQYAAKGIDTFSFYGHGGFSDLCRGPHVPRTGQLKAFKLLRLAGAYWRGIETNPMLVRIYGTAFFDQKDLKAHLKELEERKARDHRKIGKDLELFSFHPEAQGSTFWHPKGAVIYGELLKYCREVYPRYGYQEVMAPQILSEELWKKSGHWDNFQENMFFTSAGEDERVAGTGEQRMLAVKPMNCPGHCLIYGTRRRSYRELPVRYAEYSMLHRAERSGALSGLTRVRVFAQDDAHIYCTPEQLPEEIAATIALQKKVYCDLGFEDWKVRLATRPEKRVGDDDVWDRAEKALADALEAEGLPYELAPGEGAFYGPKIEFHLVDCMRRSWQCGTAQIDFSMPARFELSYFGADSKPHTPVMIHRAVLGSFERMIAMLLEHYAGDFPLWLAPEQVRVLPLGDAHLDFARRVNETLVAAGLRSSVDETSERIKKKVAEASVNKVPYMVVIGDREVETGSLAVRHRKVKELGNFTAQELAARLREEIDSRVAAPAEASGGSGT